MNQMIKVVNYIKGNALRCRIFSSLCESMDVLRSSLSLFTTLNRGLFIKEKEDRSNLHQRPSTR